MTSIRVEESRPPTTSITDRTAAKFDAHLATRNKQLFRVTNLDVWRGDNRAEPLRFPNFKLDATSPTINRALLLDLGDWVPYRKGTPVKFNVMDRDQLGVETLVIQRGAEVVEEIALEGPGLHERRFEVCGDYSAHVIHKDGTPSQACEFAVCDLELRLSRQQPFIRQRLESPVRLREHRNHRHPSLELQRQLWTPFDIPHPDQRAAGTLTIPGGLVEKPGTLQVWLIGEHDLGRIKLRKDISLMK